MAKPFKYAAKNEAPVYESISNNKGVKIINRLLMGTYVGISEEAGDLFKVVTAGPDGWMKKSDLTDNMGLKVFYLDVGQGDGVLLEIGNLRILIDGGPGNHMHGYLTKWQYTYLLRYKKPVHIDYVFISHFDADHYKGLIKVLDNPLFTFGTIYHAGILKFAARNNPYNTGLGDVVKVDKQKYLTGIFDDLLTLESEAAYNRDVNLFMKALLKARDENRVGQVKRLKSGDVPVSQNIEGNTFKIEVLAPFNEKVNNKDAFLYWNDDGKTINGHSLVLKATFGQRTMMFGGDLNTQSEEYIMSKYPDAHPFEVDVAKACHHGSSDFSEQFMQKVNPYATVISSGDNEGFSHPRADAIGCAGKYARGARPLVYSTELARSVNSRSKKVLFGMINLRSNGNEIYISQMKEVNKPSDIWDSYKL
ncbi:MAG: MBL fold metallo-hydrolase [Lentimicrobium sp.]|jgi:beta-lactamase superfamily II metal-dependent hydrolase|nr:MBL fold metallo-hydrolase [Lentimicrobium sp.]